MVALWTMDAHEVPAEPPRRRWRITHWLAEAPTLAAEVVAADELSAADALLRLLHEHFRGQPMLPMDTWHIEAVV